MQDSERRVERFQQIGVSDLDLSPWPAARIREMAEHAVLTKSSQLQVLQPERKLATLLAFVHEYEIAAIDDFLDLFDVLMMPAMSNSEKKAGETRLGGLRELDKAALVLALVCDVVLDKKVANRNVRRVIFAKTERQTLADALKIVRAQCRTSRQYDLIDALAERHRRTAALVGPLIRALSLQAGPRGQTILQQVAFAKRLLANADTDLADAPLDGLSKVWRSRVLDERDRVRKHGYLAWVANWLVLLSGPIALTDQLGAWRAASSMDFTVSAFTRSTVQCCWRIVGTRTLSTAPKRVRVSAPDRREALSRGRLSQLCNAA